MPAQTDTLVMRGGGGFDVESKTFHFQPVGSGSDLIVVDEGGELYAKGTQLSGQLAGRVLDWLPSQWMLITGRV